MRRGSYALAAGIVLALVTGGVALAATGDLTYKDCITGESESGPPMAGSGACDVVPGDTSFGAGSGMNAATAGAISPDGRSLYVAGQSDDGIVRFKRDPDNGKLEFMSCITGSDTTPACSEIPAAAVDNSGMNQIEDVEISPDGESVYVTAQADDAIARFKRASNGALTYKGCVSGEAESVTPSAAGCEEQPVTAPSGANTGFDSAHDIAISPNGKSVYLVSEDDAAIIRFKRSASGKLTYESCRTGETETGSPCEAIPGATAGAVGSGMQGAESVAITPDGDSVYVTAENSAAVMRFSPGLGVKSCITGSTTVSAGGECSAAPDATADGSASGLDNLEGVVADGSFAYVSASEDAAMTTLKVRGNGKLRFVECISGNSSLAICAHTPDATVGAIDSGLATTEMPSISPDGKSVYVGSEDHAVVHFKRAGDGTLSFKGCLTGETETGPTGTGACEETSSATSFGSESGLSEPEALAISPDSKWLYSFAQNDDAVARFKRER